MIGPMEVIGLVYVVIPVVAFWKIFGKAGFSPWLSLLTIVPLVNVAILLYVAFSNWPAGREGAG